MDDLVLRVITRLNVGGPARHVSILSRGLGAHGYRTELVSGHEARTEGYLDPGVPVTTVDGLCRGGGPAANVRAARELRKLAEARRPAIVHTHTAKAGALGRWAARRAGVRAVVHTFHGHVLSGYFPRPVSRLFVEIERRLAARTDVLLAVSERVRDELLDLGVGRPEQWRVVPVGLDLEPIASSRLEKPFARRFLDLPLRGPAVGIVGRLVPVKDHATFLDAAARIAAARPDATVVVAGDGELRASLERRAAGLGPLARRIRFLGWVHDLPSLYRALDVVVLSSTQEGTPVALIEAQAAARPVVATRVGGVAEVVRDGEGGVLVRSGDAVAMADAVLGLLADPDRAVAMGWMARRAVLPRFSAERLVRDMASLYDELLGRSRRAERAAA